MSAWAYTLVFDEEILIPYWVRHHMTFCDKVIVYVDTETTDQTRELAHAEGAEVRDYQGTGSMDDIGFITFAQQTYPEARGHADWVIWADADEIVYHRRMHQRLAELKMIGVNYPSVAGYTMFGDHPPTGPGQIYSQIRSGIESPAYAKRCIFDPALEVQWTTGKHAASVTSPISTDGGDDPIKLLHYRWLGHDWFKARNARNYSRLNAENLARQHGRETYPGATGLYSPGWYKGQIPFAVDILETP